MKKLITLMLCAVLTAALSFPAGALELRAGAKVPSSFAKISDDGKVVYTKKPTAYSPGTLNQILEAYGLKLEASNVGNTPAGYASVNDGVISFGKKPTAYSPIKLHKIFKAYGLNLSPQDVSAALGSTTYASLSDEGQIVFGKKSTAYCGEHIATILGAYKLPMTQVIDTPTDEIPTTPTEPTPIPTRTTDSDNDNIPDDQDVCPGTPPGATIDERGCWVLGEDYLFDFDKAVIKAQYYPIIDDVARVMLDNPGLRVELEGHTDSTGPAKYNQGLSQRRANAVRTYLINKGVEASRITAVGYGETRPIASNATREGRSKNRRVELTPIW